MREGSAIHAPPGFRGARGCLWGSFFFFFFFTPPPAGGGPPDALPTLSTAWMISIHALREEGDSGSGSSAADSYNISIHALREEGDTINQLRQAFQIQFLSTPSARRATQSRKLRK